jgi:arylsulfatase A-like enzyme
MRMKRGAGDEKPHRVYHRWRWFVAVIATPLVALSVAHLLGCSKSAPPVEPAEPFVVLDLLDRFDAATVTGVADAPGSGERNPAPFVNPEKGVLFVPLGVRVEYEFKLPPGSVLMSRDARNFGNAAGSLEVTWVSRGGAARVLTKDLSAAPGRFACFDNPTDESGRLVISAIAGAEDHDPRAGFRIFHPNVVAGIECEDRRAVAGDQELPGRPNIVVYLIDALRADRVGCYGYGRNTTPRIDEFASSALLFSGAQAQTSWTRTAVASIFTGLLPQQHGAIDKKDALPEAATTVAELLSGAGYESAAVVANGNISQIYGFSQGFSYYKFLQEVEIGEHVVRSEDVNASVFSWLDDARGSQPFFLYVHTVDPHLPYAPPPAIRETFAPGVDDPSIGSVESVNKIAADRSLVTPRLVEQLSNLYDGEIAANDATFGELLDGLEQRGLTENTVIVVLSDHGEEFFDHQGWSHGNTLHAEMLDVPLIIRVPGVAPRTIPEIVQHVDIFSTLVDLAGLEVPPGTFGRSARPLWAGDSAVEWTDRGLSHLQLKDRFGEAWADSRWKVMTRRFGGAELRTFLYDRREDPTEKHDLSGQRPEVVEELLERYREAVAGAGEGLDGVTITDDREAEIEAQLRALGYL